MKQPNHVPVPKVVTVKEVAGIILQASVPGDRRRDMAEIVSRAINRLRPLGLWTGMLTIRQDHTRHAELDLQILGFVYDNHVVPPNRQNPRHIHTLFELLRHIWTEALRADGAKSNLAGLAIVAETAVPGPLLYLT